jgi:hypothetical protein
MRNQLSRRLHQFVAPASAGADIVGDSLSSEKQSMISNTKNASASIAKIVLLRMGLCLGGFLCSTASADITVEGTHSPGLSGGVDRQVIYLLDDQIRIDQLAQNGSGPESVASSLLIRFSGQPAGVLYLDHGSKTAEVLSSLNTSNAAISASDSAANTVQVVRRDETWELLGQTAQRYDFSFSGNVDPLLLLGDQLPQEMAGVINIKLNVSGTSWVVPGMDGAAELAGFFATLASKQLVVRMPGQLAAAGSQGSVLSPGLSRALTEVMAHITREGFPLLTEARSQLSVDTEGYVAEMTRALLQGMGMDAPQNTESIVTRVNTSAVAPELFNSGGLPPGYTLIKPLR